MRFRQPEVTFRGGWRLDECNALSLLAAYQYHDQEAWYGPTAYRGTQNLGLMQFHFDTESFGEQRLKIGAGLTDLRVDQTLRSLNAAAPRTMPGEVTTRDLLVGAFVEQHLDLAPFTVVAGLRADVHREYRPVFSPRLLVKVDLGPTTLLRGSVGTGAHMVHVLSENVNILASARSIIIDPDLDLERALNTGVNLVQHFSSGDLTGTLTLDFYHTTFFNQITPDFDRNPQAVYVENFRGTSISNSAQAELQLDVPWDVEFKAAYNWLDVYREVEGVRQELPFNSRHKVLGSVSWQPAEQPWRVDVNAHWYGPQRLPDTRTLPEEYRQPSESPSYALVNGQLTWVVQSLEIYAGCENILDFRQERPILSWRDPFSPYFDTSFAWGPTRGREFYLGLRYRMDDLWSGHLHEEE